jgi:hypothetical protein
VTGSIPPVVATSSNEMIVALAAGISHGRQALRKIAKILLSICKFLPTFIDNELFSQKIYR